MKKTDFDDKLKHLNKKVTSDISKNLLVENEFKKVLTFDPSLLIGQSYFFNDGTQLCLMFQALCYTLKKLGDTEKIVSSKSKGLSTKRLTIPTTTDDSLSATI